MSCSHGAFSPLPLEENTGTGELYHDLPKLMKGRWTALAEALSNRNTPTYFVPV